MKDSGTKDFNLLATGYLSGTLTDQEKREFLTMIRSSRQYAGQFRKISAAYAGSYISHFESVKNDNLHNITRILSFRTERDRMRTAKRRRRLFSAAAIIVFVLATFTAGYYMLYDIQALRIAENRTVEFTVPLGSRSKAMLPDSSTVWLNSGSILRYTADFGRKNRKVTLDGEGYFEIAENRTKPFIVTADNIDVKVTGTVFNLRNYTGDNTIELDLLEGSVSVTETGSGKTFNLTPDQNMTYDRGSGRLDIVNTDASKSALWTTGKLYFVNTPLSELLKDIERSYDVQISIHSRHILEERFSGSISLSLPINEVLDYIDVDNKYEKVFHGNRITMTDR